MFNKPRIGVNAKGRDFTHIGADCSSPKRKKCFRRDDRNRDFWKNCHDYKAPITTTHRASYLKGKGSGSKRDMSKMKAAGVTGEGIPRGKKKVEAKMKNLKTGGVNNAFFNQVGKRFDQDQKHHARVTIKKVKVDIDKYKKRTVRRKKYVSTDTDRSDVFKGNYHRGEHKGYPEIGIQRKKMVENYQKELKKNSQLYKVNKNHYRKLQERKLASPFADDRLRYIQHKTQKPKQTAPTVEKSVAKSSEKPKPVANQKEKTVVKPVEKTVEKTPKK